MFSGPLFSGTRMTCPSVVWISARAGAPLWYMLTAMVHSRAPVAAMRFSVNALTSVDFPDFRRPTTATRGGRVTIRRSCSACRARSGEPPAKASTAWVSSSVRSETRWLKCAEADWI